MTDNKRVEDIIVDGFVASRDTLMGLLELNSPQQLVPFQKIMAAMRGLPAEAQADIVVPIVQKLSAAMAIDYTTERGQAVIAEFSDLYALAIQDATQFIIENMERQRQNTGRLLTGRASSLV